MERVGTLLSPRRTSASTALRSTGLIVLAAAVGLLGPAGCGRAPGPRPGEVKVLVLNFDPRIPQLGDRPVHEALEWNDPRELADGYARAVAEASGGAVRFRIVEWRDIDAFIPKTDGFLYTAETFLECWRNRETCHQPDGSDYPRLVREHGVVPLIDDGTIDELWLFGAPYFGFWESAMAGPGAFYINGGIYAEVPSARPFAIMGFSYERGVAEMLHDLCHRTEATMEHFYGGWEIDRLDTNWARFAANAHQSGGVAAVGTCHFPPNGQAHYDYANPRVVQSSAEDWLDYPHLTGRTTAVSCETWGGPDYHLNYMRWWFAHLPRAGGRNPDGRLNNWWEYVFGFWRYAEDGSARAVAVPSP